MANSGFSQHSTSHAAHPTLATTYTHKHTHTQRMRASPVQGRPWHAAAHCGPEANGGWQNTAEGTLS